MILYSDMVNDVFDSVKQAVGVHVMLLVIERALWQTKYKYEEAALITFSEDGIVLDDLASLDPERARLVAYSFITSVISILSNLVGKQLAHQLTNQLVETINMEG